MIVYFPPFRNSLIWTFKNPRPGAGHDCDPTVECAKTVFHLSSRCRLVSMACDLFIVNLFVHGKAAEVSTSALDAFLGIKLEIVAGPGASCAIL